MQLSLFHRSYLSLPLLLLSLLFLLLPLFFLLSFRAKRGTCCLPFFASTTTEAGVSTNHLSSIHPHSMRYQRKTGDSSFLASLGMTRKAKAQSQSQPPHSLYA